VARDVNRIFSNVAKVWNNETEIGKASGMLQAWWISCVRDALKNIILERQD
jgi:hypothetical protein